MVVLANYVVVTGFVWTPAIDPCWFLMIRDHSVHGLQLVVAGWKSFRRWVIEGNDLLDRGRSLVVPI